MTASDKGTTTVERISLGGRDYVSVQSLLDYAEKRATLLTEGIFRRGTPLIDTEFARGEYFELELLKHAIQSPSQVS